MRWMRGLAVLATSAALVACGGGGKSGTQTTDGGTTAPVAAVIEVLASANSVGTGGDSVGITAIVKDAKNNSLPNTAVSFSTTTGTLSNVSATTDSAGVAKANFAAGGDKTVRTATITVAAGGASGAVDVQIGGTKLTYSGPTTLALGSSTALTVSATDSNGNAIANLPVSATSALGNALSASNSVTNANGQVVVQYTATASGTDTVQFAGAGLTLPVSLTISGEDFAFVSPAPNTQVAVGTTQTLQVRYRQGGVPQAGRTIDFAATIGTLSAPSAVTDASGTASVTVASSFAGSSIVTASLRGASAQATLPVSFIATTPSRVVLQVSPTAIGPNTAGATASQATVTARVTDAASNPVTGVTVNFSQVADPSGGRLQQASAVTDTNGLAIVKYIAGATSTASGGVQLRAELATNASIFSNATLTVNQAALFIALGTGNVISNLDQQTYKKDWTVYVTDANGVAVPGVNVTVKALPVKYYKGKLAFLKVWDAAIVASPLVDPETGDIVAGQRIACENEDVDYDGVLDPGEDFNGNQTLEPGNVISVTPGNTTTDANGRATISLIYAESYVPWVRIRLQVEAVVSGTASSTSSTFDVSGAAPDFSSETVPPAGVISPFGVKPSCSDPE